ncbi:MAG TPA: hypothetical protein VL178_07090, partial [Pseudomonas sp.]|nr:hypothetical protein [Pseudomonas sp.]
MAEHVITIRDVDGGVAVTLESQGSRKTVAGLAAFCLIELAGKVIPEAARKAAEMGTCNCAKCAASRTEP